MGSIVDASVLIAAERGDLDLDAILVPAGEPYSIASITVSEMLHGVYRTKDTVRRYEREDKVERILARLPAIPFDAHTARIYGRLWADLASMGFTIAPHDLMVAATALANGATVLTRDRRSFPLVPGLDVRLC